MRAEDIAGKILTVVNDSLSVTPYGDGHLVTLPLAYSDRDSVRLLVEPLGAGVRVSDQAGAFTRLVMAGLRPERGRPLTAWREVLRSSSLFGIDAPPGEIASFGAMDDLAALTFAVAQASLQAEQLRWLAPPAKSSRYVQRLVTRVEAWAGDGHAVRRHAPIRLTSGRERQVTMAVEAGESHVYLQAVSSADQDSAAEHCYYIFDLCDLPKERRIAAVDGGPENWPSEILAELGRVGEVRFFGEPRSLEKTLDELTHVAA